MPKFTIGQKVRCVSHANGLEVGQEYEVLSESDSEWVQVRRSDGLGIWGYYPRRFEAVSPPGTYTRKEIAAAVAEVFQNHGGFPEANEALGDIAYAFGLYPYNRVELIDMDTGEVLA
jgi:hypothetical protein